MSSSSRQFGIILVGSIVFAACEHAPTEVADVAAPQPSFNMAERVVDEALYDMEGSYFAFGCTADGLLLPPGEGELIEMQGKIYEKFSVLRDAKGEYHVTYQTMPVGLRGVGVTTGEEFRVFERENGAANQLLASGMTAYRSELKMVGTSTQRTFWVITNGIIRFGLDGEVAVDRGETRYICGPARTS